MKGICPQLAAGSLVLLTLGCQVDVRGFAAAPLASSSGSSEIAASDESGESTSTGSQGPRSSIRFDFGGIPDAPSHFACEDAFRVSCDDADDDPWHALGINCPQGPRVHGRFIGAPEAMFVHTGNLGTHVPPAYPTREGDKVVILSSGIAEHLAIGGMYASTEHVGYDFGNTLPDPIRTDGVSNEGETCESHPELIGTGDCSNTIEGQWKQAAGLAGAAHDVAELRFTADVPPGINGFAFDFAMFSTEYPRYYQQQFNDMFIAWLESERWTGNVSFDEQGNPISLNAGFLDYKDAPNDIDCPQPCEAPELSGTAMEGHAATKWLTTTAPVSPGETIEVVLLVFDLSDGILDIAVMLDNFRWTCDGDAPLTRPAG